MACQIRVSSNQLLFHVLSFWSAIVFYMKATWNRAMIMSMQIFIFILHNPYGQAYHCLVITDSLLTARATHRTWLVVILSRSPDEQWVSWTRIGQPVWLDALTARRGVLVACGRDQTALWSQNSLSDPRSVTRLGEGLTRGDIRKTVTGASVHSHFRIQFVNSLSAFIHPTDYILRE